MGRHAYAADPVGSPTSGSKFGFRRSSCFRYTFVITKNALFLTEIWLLDGGYQKRPRRASLTLFFNFCRRRVVDVFFWGASAISRDPHKNAHHGCVSGFGCGCELGKRINRCKYRGFRAVTDISVLRPAYAPISHACLEAGAADAHDARPGGGQGCASSRLRFSLGIRRASIGSISGSRGEGGRGFALGAGMPLPAPGGVAHPWA